MSLKTDGWLKTHTRSDLVRSAGPGATRRADEPPGERSSKEVREWISRSGGYAAPIDGRGDFLSFRAASRPNLACSWACRSRTRTHVVARAGGRYVEVQEKVEGRDAVDVGGSVDVVAGGRGQARQGSDAAQGSRGTQDFSFGGDDSGRDREGGFPKHDSPD